MEQLAQAITNHSRGAEGVSLETAAKTWAIHCLDTYRDGLLEKGLAISVALVNFTNELNGEGGD